MPDVLIERWVADGYLLDDALWLNDAINTDGRRAVSDGDDDAWRR